jgi:hypothetical protein
MSLTIRHGFEFLSTVKRVSTLGVPFHSASLGLLAGMLATGCQAPYRATGSQKVRLSAVRHWQCASSVDKLEMSQWNAFATDRDPSVRREAALLAARIHSLPAESLVELVRLTGDSAADVRHAAQYALEEVLLPATLPSAFEPLLRDANAEMRTTTLGLLSRSSTVPGSFTDSLVVLLADPDSKVRMLAEYNLARTRKVEGDDVVALIELRAHNYGLVREVAEILLHDAKPPGVDQVDELCGLLLKDNWAIRNATTHMIGLACRDPETRLIVLDRLALLLKTADMSIDYAVAWSISEIGRDGHAWTLLPCLLEDDRYAQLSSSVQVEAEERLDGASSQLVDEGYAPPITPTDVHRVALESLRDSAPKEVGGQLIPIGARWLSDPNYHVRSAAASLLASLGDEGKFELLHALQSQGDLIRFVSYFGAWEAGGVELYDELQRSWKDETLTLDCRQDIERLLGLLIDASDATRHAVVAALASRESSETDLCLRALAHSRAVSSTVVQDVEDMFADSTGALAESCLVFLGAHGFSRTTAVRILEALDTPEPTWAAKSALLEQFDANAEFIVNSYAQLPERAQSVACGVLASGLARTQRADVAGVVSRHLGHLMGATSSPEINRTVIAALTSWIHGTPTSFDGSPWAEAAMDIVEAGSDDEASIDAARFLGLLGAHAHSVVDRMQAAINSRWPAAVLSNVLGQSLQDIRDTVDQ